MRGHKQLTSSESDDWESPECVLERVRKIDRIGLDPYSNERNPTKARYFCTPTSVPVSWVNLGLVYVNPPYSKIREISRIIGAYAMEGVELVALLPARTDTKWFKSLVWDTATAVCFWTGRLKFKGAKAGAPFPSAVVYFGALPGDFEQAFGDAGKVIRLK